MVTQSKLWVHEKIGPDQYKDIPFYEFMMFIEEWQEYIKAKVKANEEREAEAKKQKQSMQSQMRNQNRNRPKPPKLPKNFR